MRRIRHPLGVARRLYCATTAGDNMIPIATGIIDEQCVGRPIDHCRSAVDSVVDMDLLPFDRFQVNNRSSAINFALNIDAGRGGTFLHIMSGQLMPVLIDDDPSSSNNQPGLIGIEIESITKLYVRNIWLKKLN